MKRFLLVCMGLLMLACSDPVYLRKFAAIVPKQGSALAGKKVFVEAFKDTAKVDDEWKGEALNDPSGFESVDLTDEQEDLWKSEREAEMSKVQEDKYYKLGWQRNGFGVPINDVMSVNPPAPWLQDSLSQELVAQGAVLVKSAAEADLVIAGTLAYINIDSYVGVWCNVVVDLVVTPKGGAATKARVHTKGGASGWGGAGGEESSDVFRECEQRFSVHAIGRIAKIAATAAPAEAAPPEAAPAAPAEAAPPETPPS